MWSWLLLLGIAHSRLVAALDPTCTAHCAAEMKACEETGCSVGLAALLKCPHPDQQCQSKAYVRYGKDDKALQSVLGCFGWYNCTFQTRDVDTLGRHRGAQKNVTSLQNVSGAWWTVGVTNPLDEEQCGTQVFQLEPAGGWINNETLQTSPGYFSHAFPQVTMVNGWGTYTTDYRPDGWAQVENMTILSKPTDYYMLVHYCGENILSGSSCGTLLLSRFRSAKGIPAWIDEEFAATYAALGIGRQHGRGYMDMIHVDSSSCPSNTTAFPPPPWPQRFNASFTAEFNFARGDVWDSELTFDYPKHRMRLDHVDRFHGYACSYLFANGTARVLNQNVSAVHRCCVDPHVPGYPVSPSIFHDQATFSEYENNTKLGTMAAKYTVGGDLWYENSVTDGAPVAMRSSDFGGLWNFTTGFNTQGEFPPAFFEWPGSCLDVCDFSPPRDRSQTNNCFFGAL